MGTPVFDQWTYRFRNDDGSETGATWLANASTFWNPYFAETLGNNYRLRMVLREVGNMVGWTSLPFYPYYSLNGSTYNKITATTPIQISLSSNFAQGDDCTRQVWTSSTGWLVDNNGMIETVDGCVNSGSASARWEVEFCFKLDKYQLDYGDEIQIRVYQGSTALSSYYATPKITLLNKPCTVPTIVSPVDDATIPTDLPEFQFYSTDDDGDDIEYEIQIEKRLPYYGPGVMWRNSWGSVFMSEDGYYGETTNSNMRLYAYSYANRALTSQGHLNYGTQGYTFRDADAANGVIYYVLSSKEIWRVEIPIVQDNAVKQDAPVGPNYWGVAIDDDTMDVYVCDYGGDIYKQTGGTGSFVALNQTSRNWYGLTIDYITHDVYASVAGSGGDVYKQTAGLGNFVAMNLATKLDWRDVTIDPISKTLYILKPGDTVYKKEIGDSNWVSTNARYGTYGRADFCGLNAMLLYNVYYSNTHSWVSATTGPLGATFVEDSYPYSTSAFRIGLNPSNGKIYSMDSGTMYIYDNGTWSTDANWSGISAIHSAACGYNGNVYACSFSQYSLWYQPGGSGTVSVLLYDENKWIWSIECDHSNGDVFYLDNKSGQREIYKQTGGSGSFVAIGVAALINDPAVNCDDITAFCINSSTHDMYVVVDGNLYVRYGGTENFTYLLNGLSDLGYTPGGISYADGWIYAVGTSWDIFRFKPDGSRNEFMTHATGSRIQGNTYSGYDCDFIIGVNSPGGWRGCLLFGTATPKLEFSSAIDSGFENLDTPLDTSPFNQGENVQFSLQVGDELEDAARYVWRVRAKDTDGQ